MATNYITIPRADFDSIAPWNGMKRCLVGATGTVNYYLDPNDSSKKADGTAAKLDGTDGDVMVEIPKFYYKVDNGVNCGPNKIQWFISDVPKTGYEVHPAFYRDRNGDGIAEEVNYRYCSAFEGSVSSSKLVSRANAVPQVSQTIGTFRTQAQSKGNGWGLLDFNLLSAIQLLYLLEYGHFDSQTKLGKGVSSATAKINTGATVALGNKSGSANNNLTSGLAAMSYRGIENFYGNIHKWIDGLVTGTNTILIGNKSFNDTGSGYTSYAKTFTGASGYIANIWGDKQLGFIPSVFGGSAAKKLYDSGALTAGCLPAFGGHWGNGATCGAFSLSVAYGASDSISSFGARLAF